MSTVVLLSTRRLLPADLDAARNDLGGDPALGLDVIGWLPPADPLDDKVSSFTLVGPQQPAAEAGRQHQEDRQAQQDKQIEPPGQVHRLADKLLPKAIKRPVRVLRNHRAGKELGKAYWTRVQAHPDALRTIERADVVVALDPGAIWAGWNLGQRRPNTPVVLGLPAARRELDQLKAPARHE